MLQLNLSEHTILKRRGRSVTGSTRRFRPNRVHPELEEQRQQSQWDTHKTCQHNWRQGAEQIMTGKKLQLILKDFCSKLKSGVFRSASTTWRSIQSLMITSLSWPAAERHPPAEIWTTPRVEPPLWSRTKWWSLIGLPLWCNAGPPWGWPMRDHQMSSTGPSMLSTTLWVSTRVCVCLV